MDRDESRALIATRLGNRTDQDTAIVQALGLAQQELEQGTVPIPLKVPWFLPWFLLSGFVEITNGTDSFGEIDLPAGWLMEPEEEHTMWLLDASGGNRVSYLERDDIGAIRRSGPTVSSTGAGSSSLAGTPTHYDIVGSTIYLGPLVPTEQLYFEYLYYKAADALSTSDATNNWLTYAPEVLTNLAGYKVAFALRDEGGTAIFLEMFTSAYHSMYAADQRRRYSGKSPSMRFTHEV